jgi:hypothetical protein
MRKIAVGRTIAEAYGFAFGRFPANLGVTWLPFVLLGAAAYFALPPYFASLQQAMTGMATLSKSGNPAEAMTTIMAPMMGAYRIMLLFMLVLLFVRTQIMLGLTRNALGMSKGPGFVFLSFGAAFWRLFASVFIVLIFILAIYIALLIVIFIATAIIGATAVSALHSADRVHAVAGVAGVGLGFGLAILPSPA